MEDLWERIRVRAYAGIKGSEKPREIFLDNHPVLVKVISEWLEEDIHFKKRKRYFRVIGVNTGEEYLICYDAGSKEWFRKK
ncbi:MAG: hypothetical protein GXO97_06555 [Nitrospirae bacterium]|nr:hypothetical protein [Nitrospirota bacterium]